MGKLRGRRLTGPLGFGVLLLLLGVWHLSPGPVRETLRERSLDTLLPLLPRPALVGSEVMIVDIDRATLAQYGPWPWPRARLAQLVGAVAAARPAALALDILIAGPDRFSLSAMLRREGSSRAPVDVAGWADALPSGDALLGAALSQAPAVLGFALDSEPGGELLRATPILAGGPIALPRVWRAESVVGPVADVAAGAQGFGALVAAADPDGPIRRVPLLVMAGGTLRPGLAVEAVRLAGEAGTLLIERGGVLRAGAATAPLGPDASLRLVQPPPAAWQAQTLSALPLLAGEDSAGRALGGRIVLIGSSAPELGGLRVTPVSPATPSVQIQAEAVEQLLRGPNPYRPVWLDSAELAGAALLGLLGLGLAAWRRPLPAAGLAALVWLAWACGAAASVSWVGLLVDPAGPVAVAAASFAIAALARFAQDEWRAQLLRVSFEQHLAPDVVRRLAADPAALRLQGEMREITALFTDIEGFTSLTERADAVELVSLLDAYFDAAAGVVMEHGGMVEKIVGDAIHAIFNAPFALEGHPARAVACALALLEATESVRRSPLGRGLALGRTRIGIETGTAIVGDVGGRRKLDYTAHGDAVNTAARLEAANKELGSSICIGPGTAARLDPSSLHRIGTLTLRGQSRSVEVFTPVTPTPRPP